MSTQAAPAVASSPGVVSASVAGFEVTGTHGGTSEELEKSLREATGETEPEGDDKSPTASEIGRKGGKAAAAARKAAAKEAKAEPEAAAEPEAEPGEAKEAAPEKKPGHPRDDPKARIQQLNQRAKAAEEAHARERARNEELERRLQAVERGTAPAPEKQRAAEQPRQAAPHDDPDDPEPREEDHADYGAYMKALGAWSGRQAFREEASKHQQAARENHARRAFAEAVDGVRRSFTDSVKAAAESDPEFYNRIAPEVSDLEATIDLDDPRKASGANFLADEILNAGKHAPSLMLHLSEHKSDFQRIAQLGSRREVATEVAYLRGRLDERSAAATAGTSAGREVSKAPPPVKPVHGAPSAASGEYGPRPGESFDDWNRRTAHKR